MICFLMTRRHPRSKRTDTLVPYPTLVRAGRTILDRASANLPAKSRTGLIGRNGAGKSTLMKAMIGSLEADEGGIEMPRRTRIGYIAQDAPSGTATPFETVLAADTERAELLAQSETVTDPDRLGDIHERLIARSEEHTSELQSLMRNSYAVFCLKK